MCIINNDNGMEEEHQFQNHHAVRWQCTEAIIIKKQFK